MRAFLDFLVNNFGVYFESGSEVFLWFFNRAVAASWLILAVVVLRLLIKKAPKWITCALWGICVLRLVLPFSLQSVLSLIPSAQTVVPESIYENKPQIDSGIPIIDENVNAQITEQYFEGVTVPKGATLNFTSIIAILWMIGILALLTYSVVSYVKLKKCVKGANMLEKGVLESANVSSPFILGIFNPKIYLPLNMDEETKTHVLSHERAHISRCDHILKPLGFVILSLYWFSPLVWAAYILFCRDIELACDEKVVSKLEKNSRANYAQALLSCATQKRTFSACPIAFGEVSIKDRVKSALHYKKPMLWVIIAAVITTVAVAVCFLTDPIKSIQTGTDPDKDDTSSSITSSEISKDETSSHPSASSEPSKDETSSKKDNSSVTSKDQTSSKDNASKKPSKQETSSQKPTSSSVPTINENLLINKPNAYIPTEITRVDSIEGKDVNFETKNINMMDYADYGIWDDCFAVVRSLDELKALYQTEKADPQVSNQYQTMFLEKFFEDNILIVLFDEMGPPFMNNVENVTKKEENLFVYIDNSKLFDGGIDANSDVRTFITVSKDDIKDVENILVYKKW